MKLKKVLFFPIIIICSLVLPPSIPLIEASVGGFPFGGAAPFDPNMSEEELLAKLMEEINATIPENQREQFWKEVEAETRRIEEATAHMNDDEKNAYLMNQMNAAMNEAQPIPAAPIEEVKEKQVEKPTPKLTPTKEAIQSDEIIKSIVKSINSFINKASAFPDFERKIDNWANQHLLSNWPDEQNWETFKNELNRFNSLLQRFQERDVKIGMKHIDTLTKNEHALQMLKQLETKLAEEVPSIDVSVFSITSMSKQTKNAIAHTINALTESIYKLKIKETLQKIIEEFDPAAKKLREEEEKAAKEALEKTKRAPSSVAVRTAGKAESKGDFFLPSFDDFGGAGYDSGYAGYDSGSGGYGDQGFSSSDAKGGITSSSPSASKGGAAAGGEKGSAKEGAGSSGKAPEPITSIKNPDVKEHVDTFKKSYGEAHSLLLPIKDNL